MRGPASLPRTSIFPPPIGRLASWFNSTMSIFPSADAGYSKKFRSASLPGCASDSLAPDSDSVVYQGRVIHVASWAARFLFTGEDLNRPVGRLSGGERARVLIAQLMLQPADVLLLDEPTNDLDIPTLEILAESLLEFSGALVLVTHDRFLLDRVSTIVFGLDGFGGAERFADYFQWEEWKAQNERAHSENPPSA